MLSNYCLLMVKAATKLSWINLLLPVRKITFIWTVRLRNQLTEMRVVKQPIEIDIMSFVNDVSSEALITVMQAAKEHLNCEEFQAEALFKFECFKRGCRRVG